MNQARAQLELLDAIDTAPSDVPCTNYPDAFFPEWKSIGGREMAANAKSLCKECPIIQQCAEYGIRFARYGIWGGLLESEREAIRAKLGIELPKEELDLFSS